MSAQHVVHLVEDKDAIVCCPPEGVEVWNLHPRVYLALNEEGSVDCPYCGDVYKVDEK